MANAQAYFKIFAVLNSVFKSITILGSGRKQKGLEVTNFQPRNRRQKSSAVNTVYHTTTTTTEANSI